MKARTPRAPQPQRGTETWELGEGGGTGGMSRCRCRAACRPCGHAGSAARGAIKRGGSGWRGSELDHDGTTHTIYVCAQAQGAKAQTQAPAAQTAGAHTSTSGVACGRARAQCTLHTTRQRHHTPHTHLRHTSNASRSRLAARVSGLWYCLLRDTPALGPRESGYLSVQFRVELADSFAEKLRIERLLHEPAALSLLRQLTESLEHAL